MPPAHRRGVGTGHHTHSTWGAARRSHCRKELRQNTNWHASAEVYEVGQTHLSGFQARDSALMQLPDAWDLLCPEVCAQPQILRFLFEATARSLFLHVARCESPGKQSP